MTPDISRVVTDKNRNITNNFYSFAGRIFSQFPPLPEKLPLNIFLDADLRTKFDGSFFILFRCQESQAFRPFFPGPPLVAPFQSHKQGIVMKPWSCVAKIPEFLFARRGIVSQKNGACCLEQSHFLFKYRFKVNADSIWAVFVLYGRKIAIGGNLLEIYKQRVACESRKCGVRGITA